MKKILDGFIWLVSKVIGRNNLEKLLVYAAKEIHADLHLHGLIQIGAVSSFNQHINGEEIFLEKTLPDLLASESNRVFFDIGANIGDYALELRKCFPKAAIYSFEPVKTTFEMLVKNTAGHNIITTNTGFSSSVGTGKLFNTVTGDNTEIASVYKDVFEEVFDEKAELVAIEFAMDTLDNFCQANNITKIDFLKVDVEGHEFSVLQGATALLKNQSIKVIQFEFNSHNVYSRVFLRDFYLLLQDFQLYRIVKNGLIKLGTYSHINEIFMLQNIVAIHNNYNGSIGETSLISTGRK